MLVCETQGIVRIRTVNYGFFEVLDNLLLVVTYYNQFITELKGHLAIGGFTEHWNVIVGILRQLNAMLVVLQVADGSIGVSR